MRTHRVLRATAVAAALLAAGSPAAASAASQDLRSPDARDAATAVTASQDLRSPDARDIASRFSAPSPATDLRSPDARDAAIGRGTAGAPAVTVVRLPLGVAADDGIDWTDAGIGAGLALLLATGAVV